MILAWILRILRYLLRLDEQTISLEEQTDSEYSDEDEDEDEECTSSESSKDEADQWSDATGSTSERRWEPSARTLRTYRRHIIAHQSKTPWIAPRARTGQRQSITKRFYPDPKPLKQDSHWYFGKFWYCGSRFDDSMVAPIVGISITSRRGRWTQRADDSSHPTKSAILKPQMACIAQVSFDSVENCKLPDQQLNFVSISTVPIETGISPISHPVISQQLAALPLSPSTTVTADTIPVTFPSKAACSTQVFEFNGAGPVVNSMNAESTGENIRPWSPDHNMESPGPDGEFPTAAPPSGLTQLPSVALELEVASFTESEPSNTLTLEPTQNLLSGDSHTSDLVGDSWTTPSVQGPHGIRSDAETDTCQIMISTSIQDNSSDHGNVSSPTNSNMVTPASRSEVPQNAVAKSGSTAGADPTHSSAVVHKSSEAVRQNPLMTLCTSSTEDSLAKAHELMRKWITHLMLAAKYAFPIAYTPEMLEEKRVVDFCVDVCQKMNDMHAFVIYGDSDKEWNEKQLPRQVVKSIGIRRGEYMTVLKRKLKDAANKSPVGIVAEAWKAFNDFDDGLFRDVHPAL